jgi:hypothetical protein
VKEWALENINNNENRREDAVKYFLIMSAPAN